MIDGFSDYEKWLATEKLFILNVNDAREFAFKTLKVKPHECLMVGDRVERDIEGARKLGIITCFARYGNPRFKKKKSNADYEINSIKEKLYLV